MGYPSYDTTASQYQQKLVSLNKRGYKDPKAEGQLNIYGYGVAEEAGEVLGLVKRHFRGDNIPPTEFRQKLSKEIGDAIAYLTLVAEVFDLDLGNILDFNLAKLEDRISAGTQLGSGSDR